MNKDIIIEKDYIDSKTGKRCLIVFNRMGIRCAYVEVNKNIPLSAYYERYDFTDDKEKDSVVILSEALSKKRRYKFNEANIYVHGGITFADKLSCLEDNTEFVGIDFAHYGDLRDLESFKKYFGTKDIMYKTLIELDKIERKCGKIYNVEDVQTELEELVSEVYKYEQSELKRLKRAKAYRWKHRDKKKEQKKLRWKQG